jgi:DNA-nicking Smr family endonuclease
MARRRRQLSEGERALWRKVTEDVAPLVPPPKAQTSKTVPAPAPPKPSADGEAPAPPAKPKTAPPQPPRRAPSPPPRPTPQQLRTGGTPGIDRRTADRARKGKLAIDARLDLHGLSQAEAHTRLNAFIASAQAAGHRMVLVITGRGNFTGGRSVLKQQLPRWLGEPPVAGKILGYTAAQPRHGGEGAWYVLIKRQR